MQTTIQCARAHLAEPDETSAASLAVPVAVAGLVALALGIAVWASEFEPAAKLLDFVKAKVRAWEAWAKQQAWWVKGLLGLACFLVVAGAIWLVLWMTGIPSFVPGDVAGWLRANAGL